MRIKSVVSSVVIGVAFVAGVPLATGSAQTSASLPECATAPYSSEPVHFEEAGKWSYDYHVVWCGNSGEIDWVVPVLTHEIPEGSDCVWVRDQETQSPVGDEVHAFAMSEFSCTETLTTLETPWSIVAIGPDGRNRVAGGGVA